MGPLNLGGIPFDLEKMVEGQIRQHLWKGQVVFLFKFNNDQERISDSFGIMSLRKRENLRMWGPPRYQVPQLPELFFCTRFELRGQLALLVGTLLPNCHLPVC